LTSHHGFQVIRNQTIQALVEWASQGTNAASIERLSDIYIDKNSDLSQIWKDKSLARAYVSYFMPLNILRLTAVYQEASELNFFTNLTNAVDFGSGPGTADIAAGTFASNITHWQFIEKMPEAIEWHKQITSQLSASLPTNKNRKWAQKFTATELSQSLVIFSYAYNELNELPKWAYDAEALLIIEPSTQLAGRKLQHLRSELIQKKFYAWAPCLHQEECPLLKHSKTDWCHNRIHVEIPNQLKTLEEKLPMKNQTLTYSYLLMRKTPPGAAQQERLVRIIGDTQYERGKVKQAICRNSKREHLTWLTRGGEPTPLQRGVRFQLPADVQELAHELRMP
jgi:ribosomal protein RSM22 (predicted rRNA methylase)